MLHIKRNVMYVQAWNCWLCVHVGSTALFIGKRKNKPALVRIELFTPLHTMRIS